MNKIRYCALIVCLLAAVGCKTGIPGSGTRKTETRSLAAATRMTCGGAYTLHLRSGPPACTIEADDNLLTYIKTTVRNGELTIDTTESINPRGAIVVNLTEPALTSLKISGAATVDWPDIKSADLAIDCNGAATMTLAGQVNTLNVDVSGTATIAARGLHSKDVRISMSGAGSAEVYASDSLDASMSGAGTIRYDGKPKSVKQNVSGVGSVSAF